MIGKTLGHCKIAERIGACGTSVVRKVRDLPLDHSVVLKILPPDKIVEFRWKRLCVQDTSPGTQGY